MPDSGHRHSRRRPSRILKKGLVDIVIGTHRVLSRKMWSSKIWDLLIIDEEQRFGVAA